MAIVTIIILLLGLIKMHLYICTEIKDMKKNVILGELHCSMKFTEGAFFKISKIQLLGNQANTY